MKDRTRQAVFNLLGTSVKDKHAIDLFAGTGALGLEAISRGAARATLIEQHIPTARLIEKNVLALGVEQRVQVIRADTFNWVSRWTISKDLAWVIFCSPPYDFYTNRCAAMVQLIRAVMECAPAQSVFVVEADDRFDLTRLPRRDEWDIRRYRPAIIALFGTEPAAG